ncbi:MAG: enoyl-CoA hydratase-related protein [Pseudomonadota bacterium]
MSEDILYERQGAVAVLRFNRPDELNAVTLDTLAQLVESLDRAVQDGARAVLLTGNGRAFCAGASLTGGGATGDLGDRLRNHYNPVARKMAELDIPIVSAVNGPAAGAGVGFALGADIVVAARSAYFLLAFANIGLVPDAGSTWLVARAVGRAKALEMALLGGRLSAAEALGAGLITRVVDDEAVFADAMAIAKKLAAMPTLALGLIRKQIRIALSANLEDALEVEAEHQAIAGASADFREGVAAFLEKRKPVFDGR